MVAKNYIVTMTRGDSEYITIPLNPYELQEGDTVYFGLMDPGQYFEEALLKKKFDMADINSNNDLIITIDPEDTLDLLPGKYYYSLKLHINHADEDSVVTLLNKKKFIICD